MHYKLNHRLPSTLFQDQPLQLGHNRFTEFLYHIHHITYQVIMLSIVIKLDDIAYPRYDSLYVVSTIVILCMFKAGINQLQYRYYVDHVTIPAKYGMSIGFSLGTRHMERIP